MKTTVKTFLRAFLLISIFLFAGLSFSQTYKILFDNSKAQTAGNADWKIDDNEPYPDPANPTSESDWVGGISSWGYELWQTGNYQIVQLPAGSTITYGDSTNPLDLSNFDVFVCVEPNIQFTDSEKEAIISFVENGGGLFVVADHNGSDRNNDGIDSPRVWNDLFNNNPRSITNIFGVTFNLNSISGDYTALRTNRTEPEDDALFNGSFGSVTGIAYHSGASMTVDSTSNPNARGQIWIDSNYSDSDVVVATSRFGNGRIAFIGDSSPCDDGTGQPGDTLYDGWNESGVTDREIFLNLTEWLAQGGGASSGISIGTPATDPANPDNGDAVTVSVEITDDGSITSAVLMWKTFKDDTFNSENMTNTSGDIYEATIPAQSNTIIQYKIVATDNDANTSSAGLYSYQVGYIPICDLRDNANDADGVNKYNNLNVKVTGIVTVPTVNGFGSSGQTDIYIQDSSGCGINVYNSGSDQPQVVLGDVVEVTGKVTQYKGKLEIDISTGSMTVLATDTVPAPQIITCSQLDESYEGKLVRINNVHIVSGTIPSAGSSGGLTIEDSSGQATIYVDKDTDIDGMDTPSGDFDIIGIVSQYDSTSPYTSGYQLMPRSQADFVISGGTPTGKELYFSEYIEGSNNNKALEIFNETGAPVDLSEYEIQLYVNGGTSPSKTITLSGTLNDGETFAICNSSADTSLQNRCQMTSGSLTFNGDDALVLVHNGTVVDSIGRVGEDPGAAWTGNGISTQNMTLRRKPHIHQGDTTIDDAFDPSVEWDGYVQDTIDDIGQHTSLYTLHVEVSEGQGSTNPSGDNDYQYNTVVSITATPDNGYVFSGWTGFQDSSDNPITVTMSQDITLYAHFSQSSGGNAERVYFSEYVEGSSNNKAVEIYNESGSDIDLSEYTIEIYSNGATSVTHTVSLSGTLVDGDAFVIANPGASQTLLNLADATDNGISYNGNDAIVLKHNGNVIDSIGQVGNNSNFGKDVTLRRKPHIHQGDTNPDDAFDRTVEWDVYAKDTFDDLGQHSCLYYLTTSVLSGNGSVTPSGTTEHQYKTSVTVTATPDNGYVFDHWEGDFNSTDNPFTFTIRNDTNIQAVFVQGSSGNQKDLYFSEYIEGSHSNNAVEIFNETGSNVDLSGYTIEIYNNNHTSPDHTINLSGTIADGDVYVIVYSSASQTLLNLADYTTGALSFNGNDAIVLKHNGNVIDAIGQIGNDDSYYGSNKTLRRKPHVHQGDTNPDDAFDPSVEWDEYPQDTFAGLGSHECLYTLTTTVTGGGGSVIPSGTNDYQYKTSIQITATSDNGYVFAGWSGDVTSANNPLTLTMDRDYTIGATFSPLGSNGKDLYFSEYIEGSHSNKAVEIFNETGSNIDLSNYTIEIYNNGHSSPDHTIALSGTLNDGDTFMIVFNQADAALQNLADLVTAELSFNGDDAIVLKDNGVIVDCIGQIGFQPNDAWENNGVSTKDMTLRRKPHIHQGDANPSDAFDPSVEWDSYPQDTFDGLGSHECLYTLTVNIIAGNGAVNPTGVTDYQYNTQVQVTAAPDSNSVFFGWSGDMVSTDNPLTVTLNRDYTLNASFGELGANGKDLYFSEYLEGSGNNKAIEIYNETGIPIDLSAYTVEIYNNGNSSPNQTITLSGILDDGDTFVIVFNQADAVLQNVADLVTSKLSFSGNDAIVLKNMGIVIDCIGQIGVNPGSAGWTGNGVSTKNMDLRRKPTIHHGDSNPDDAFDPSVEWDGYNLDDFSNIGNHQAMYSLTVNIGSGQGVVNPSGTNLYPYGSQVQITATPATGYVFAGWIGDIVSNLTSITVTMIADISITANFTPVFHTITAMTGANGSILPSGTVQVLEGTDAVFTFFPDEGYKVDKVIVDGNEVEASNFYVFHNVMSDHTISVTFEKAIPPVISDFSLSSIASNAPFAEHATVDAYDPDGGRIVRYIWNISGKRNNQIISSLPTLDYTFVVDGIYYLSVTVIDDEGESTTSQVFEINVSQSSPVVIPLPTLHGLGTFKSDMLDVSTTVVNIFDEEATITLDAFDENGELVEEKEITIPPHGTFKVSSLEFNSDFETLRAVADKYVVLVADTVGETFETSCYISAKLKGELYVPHIAEETEYWNSFGYISNPLNFSIIASVSGQDYDLGNLQSTIVDFESLVPGEPVVETNWGIIKPELENPFDDSNVLSGFEIFVKEGMDGASIEMNTLPSKVLYLSHIPEETDQFWTGLVLLNTEEEAANVNIEFYTSDGLPAGIASITVEAKSKYKTLISEILPESAGSVSWAVVTSDKKLVGAELFGTYNGAICGYSLSGKASTWGIFPEILGNDYWTGIGIVNVNTELASVTLILRDKDGNIKAEKQIAIEGLNRFKAVVGDLFESVNIEDGDTITFSSDKPITGIKISGDFNGKILKALSSVE